MSADRSSDAVRRGSLLTVLSGVALVGIYFVLKAFDVVGQPTDIGGGFVLLVGYVLTAVGVVLIALDLVRHRSERR
jgi:hypothetical protein